jgi:hypothetical protein
VEAAFPDLLTVAGTGDTVVEDFLGSFIPLPDGGFEFVYGPLVIAMRDGRALLVDDAPLIPPKVLAVLYPAMDGRRVITIPGYRNERVEAGERFYVIAGHNLLLTELTCVFPQVSALRGGWVLSGPVRDSIVAPRALASLVVPRVGWLRETGDRWEPYVLIDPVGERVDAVDVFFRDLQAARRSESTLRSYGMDLLRWFRFLWAIDVAWQRATRVEARDFSCWIAVVTRKPVRGGARQSAPGTVNAVTGKSSPGPGYAETTRAHSETVLRRFYDLHLEMGSGPLVNPFPLDRSRRTGRTNITTQWSRSATTARACTGRRCRSGSRGAFRTSSSTRCSPRCRPTGTGPWWRSGCRPAPGPPNCWGHAKRMPTSGSS